MTRSVWKGPFVDGYLLKKAEATRASGRKEVIRTWSRRSTILPQFVGLTFGVHNGRKFVPVLVTENMYGDILSDAAAALVGGLGLVASANLGDEHILVEPVHGSAPDIAGRGIANPIATVRALVLLLRELGDTQAAGALEGAIEAVLRSGPHTPDLGGTAKTAQVGDAVVAEIQK